MRIFQRVFIKAGLLALASPIVAASLLIEDAESGTGGILERTLDVFDLIQSEIVPQGSNAFFLGHTRDNQIVGPDQAIEINQLITPTATTFLYFESRLGYSTILQTISVDVQEQGTSPWHTIWSENGWWTGTESPPPFSLETVSLSGWAGKTIKLRFRHALGSGGYIPVEHSDGTVDYDNGWVFDNIQVGDEFITRAWDIGSPSGAEQLTLEFINRARADSQADVTRLTNTDEEGIVQAYEQFEVDLTAFANQFAGTDFGPGAQQTGKDVAIAATLPPLAPNPKLLETARLHTEDMFNNQFQGHSSSSSPVSPNEPGDQISQRVTKQGYDWQSIAENVSSFSNSIWESHAAFVVDWGTSGTTGLTYKGMQDPAGHRNNIFGSQFREIGIGVIEGTNGSVGPILVTHAFGTDQTRDQPFVTGVAYHDFDGDGFYSIGEGIGSITAKVPGSVYHCLTPDSGGYALPMDDNGDYTLGFALPDCSTLSVPFAIENQENAKVDIQLSWSAPTASGSSNTATGIQSTYTHSAIPTATGYRWSLRAASNWSGFYDAESTEPLTGSPSTTHVSAIARPSGSGTGSAYRLLSPDGEDAYLTLDSEILPGSTASIDWQDFAGKIEATQKLVLQASTDGGTTWETLESRQGSGDTAPQSFTTRSVSLAAYDGQATQLRFGITNPPSTLFFSNTDSLFGWYVDDIEFSDTQILGSASEEDTTSPSWTFTPVTPGEFVLQSKVLNGTNVYPGGPFLPISISGTVSRDSLLAATDLGEGWKLSTWLGAYYEQDTDWIYRSSLGWIYYGGTSGSGIWFYEQDTYGWIWMDTSIFPYFYRSSDSAWYYLLESGDTSQVYKYDTSSSTWVAVAGS